MQAKAALKAELSAYEREIEQALARSRERERQAILEAPPAARNEIVKRLTMAEEMRQQVSIFAAKQARRTGRRPSHAPATPSIGPTPERVAKAGEDGIGKLVPPITDGGTRPNTRAHQVKLALDNKSYRAKLPAAAEEVATDIVHIFLVAMAGARVTGSYDGVPATAGAAKAGGVQDFVREAHSTAEAIARELGEGVIRDITWHLTGQVVKPDGSAMRLADSGRMMSPWTVNDEKDTAVGFGGLYRSLEVLARWMGQRRAAGWRLPTIDAEADQTVALVRLISQRADTREQRARQAYSSRVLARFMARRARLQWQGEPSADDVQQFHASVQARTQVRRERADKERRRNERHSPSQQGSR